MKATEHRFWLCALLVCMVLSVFAGITAPPAMAANISSTDWMETVPDETKLSNMSIPGTHDSCTQYVDMRYIFQCQDASVATQLIYGYRYLDMRLVLEQKHDQQTLVLKHSIARCKTSNSPFAGTLTLDDVLARRFRVSGRPPHRDGHPVHEGRKQQGRCRGDSEGPV